MSSYRYGMALAAKEHLASGRPLTKLEAIVLFGVSNLPDVISDLRRNGSVVHSRLIPYAAALARVNEFATVTPPANLPIRQIQVTEYWLGK